MLTRIEYHYLIDFGKCGQKEKEKEKDIRQVQIQKQLTKVIGIPALIEIADK